MSDNATIVQRADQVRQQKTGVLRGHLGSCVAIWGLHGDVECFFATWLCFWNLTTVSNYSAGILNRSEVGVRGATLCKPTYKALRPINCSCVPSSSTTP